MQTKTLGALFIITSSFFYASYGVWTVLMGDFFGGYTASGLRSLVVLAILLLFTLLFRGFEPLDWKLNWQRLLGMVLVSTLVWGPLYWSVLEVGIGMALSVNYSAIVIGFLFFGWLLAKESLNRTKVLSAGLGIFGLFLVFVPTVTGVIAFLPLAAALVSGLAISVNTIWAKQLTYDTTQATLFLWLTSVLANLPLAFILQEPMPIFEFRAEWIYLVLFGVASVLSSWLLLRGMKYIEAGKAGILGLLEIVFGVAFGILLFNEKLESIAIVGIGMILVAASLPYFSRKPAKEIVWVFGTSASGKETFIKSVVEDDEYKDKLEWQCRKVTFAKSSVENIGHFENDPVLEKRTEIVSEVKSLLTDNDVVLIKWQFVDSDAGRVESLKADLPDYVHKIIVLDTPDEVLAERLKRKAWWTRGSKTQKWIDEEKILIAEELERYGDFKTVRL